MNSIVSPPAPEAPPYEEFYGLVQSPFTLAPDPRFFYLSRSHDATLTQLLEAVGRKSGIAILTGDSGTGKTTLCRSLVERLDPTCFTSLHLNPFVSVEELLREILLDFGVVSKEAVRGERVAAASKQDLLRTLQDFLVSLVPIRGTGVLIIDEAQHLAPPVLDELRTLSELETNQTRLLQVVLVGQTNLLDNLTSRDLRQLNERITVRATLSPLAATEVAAYIAHRLSIAHGASSVSFEGAAVERVYDVSQGVPRTINQVCDRALTIGAGFKLRAITADVVSESATALGLRAPRSRAGARKDRLWRWAALAAALIALIAALLLFAPLSNPF